MAKIFYHNITKGVFNESNSIDFMVDYEEGDLIMYTEAGCAILLPLSDEELNELVEESNIECDE